MVRTLATLIVGASAMHSEEAAADTLQTGFLHPTGDDDVANLAAQVEATDLDADQPSKRLLEGRLLRYNAGGYVETRTRLLSWNEHWPKDQDEELVVTHFPTVLAVDHQVEGPNRMAASSPDPKTKGRTLTMFPELQKIQLRDGETIEQWSKATALKASTLEIPEKESCRAAKMVVAYMPQERFFEMNDGGKVIDWKHPMSFQLTPEEKNELGISADDDSHYVMHLWGGSSERKVVENSLEKTKDTRDNKLNTKLDSLEITAKEKTDADGLFGPEPWMTQSSIAEWRVIEKYFHQFLENWAGGEVDIDTIKKGHLRVRLVAPDAANPGSFKYMGSENPVNNAALIGQEGALFDYILQEVSENRGDELQKQFSLGALEFLTPSGEWKKEAVPDATALRQRDRGGSFNFGTLKKNSEEEKALYMRWSTQMQQHFPVLVPGAVFHKNFRPVSRAVYQKWLRKPKDAKKGWFTSWCTVS